jgi:hypothetical protein
VATETATATVHLSLEGAGMTIDTEKSDYHAILVKTFGLAQAEQILKRTGKETTGFDKWIKTKRSVEKTINQQQ